MTGKDKPPYLYGWYEDIFKNEKDLEILIEIIRIYSQDIGMKFGREKCGMPINKKGKRNNGKIELLNQESSRTLRKKGNYK